MGLGMETKYGMNLAHGRTSVEKIAVEIKVLIGTQKYLNFQATPDANSPLHQIANENSAG